MEKKEKNSVEYNAPTIEYIEFSSEHDQPLISVQQGDMWVKNGARDDYPEYLLKLYRTSGLHRSVIDKKVNMIIGDGIDTKNKPNPYETMTSLFKKISKDYEIHGEYYLQVLYDAVGRPSEYYRVAPERMRPEPKKDKLTDIVKNYFFWEKEDMNISDSSNINDFIKIPTYQDESKTTTILHIKKDSPTNDYFGEQGYQAGNTDIETYSNISSYHHSNLINNFQPGLIVLFKGPSPTKIQKKAIQESFNQKYKGVGNIAREILIWSTEDQEMPEIHPADTNNIDKQFNLLWNTIKENIILSHGINRQIVGLETAGSLGNSKEILQVSQMFRNDYVKEAQKSILDGLNIIENARGNKEMIVKNPSPSLLMFDFNELLMVFTQNEIREFFGYPDLLEEQTQEIIEDNTENIDVIHEDEEDVDVEGVKKEEKEDE